MDKYLAFLQALLDLEAATELEVPSRRDYQQVPLDLPNSPPVVIAFNNAVSGLEGKLFVTRDYDNKLYLYQTERAVYRHQAREGLQVHIPSGKGMLILPEYVKLEVIQVRA